MYYLAMAVSVAQPFLHAANTPQYVSFFSVSFTKRFLTAINTLQVMIVICTEMHVDLHVKWLLKLKTLHNFSYNSPTANFVKIHPEVLELLQHTVGLSD
jgi:hypothetical protein